jgi:Cd2+/Zn2+-exporting ATPase
MLQRLMAGFMHPARRRLGLTIASGALILLAVIAGYGFGADGLWSAAMIAAAVVAGSDIAVRAVQALRLRHLSIELLVTVAALGAMVIGEYWEAAAVTFLFIFGAWLEARTMRQTRGALKALIDAAPATATVLRDGQPVEVAASAVSPGETVLVKAGQRIPVDGEVIQGAAAVSEAAITGESIPVEKIAGSAVYTGTIAENGALRIRATQVGADTTLARIVSRVEQAQEEKAPTQRLIERFAQWYTPGIMALSALTWAISGDVRLALTLLVVGCPGALVISTPVSIVAGIGRAARSGILIKGGQHLEEAGRIDAVALDKTGTLTEGRPQLVAVVPLAGHGRDTVLNRAAIAEAASDHPLGRPIIQAAEAKGAVPPADHVEEIAGMGLVADHAGQRIAAGNRRLIDRLGIPVTPEAEAALADLLSRGQTVVMVAIDGQLAGLLGLADQPRASAAPMIRRLRKAGVARIVMLTGDQPAAAAAIAAQVGIDEVHASLLPEQKLELIRKMRAEGHHVAMIGDGINDAPALAAANTAIAMGAAGSDVAIETADIALMTDDLDRIPEAVAISRATLANMRQNLVIALVTVAGLMAGVFSGDVHMAEGMLIHQLSVLIVIANGMRLLRTPAVRQPETSTRVMPAPASSRGALRPHPVR